MSCLMNWFMENLIDFEVVEHFSNSWQIEHKVIMNLLNDLYLMFHEAFSQLNIKDQESIYTGICMNYTHIKQIDFFTLTNNNNLIDDALALKTWLTKNNPLSYTNKQRMLKITIFQFEKIELISLMMTILNLSKPTTLNNNTA